MKRAALLLVFAASLAAPAFADEGTTCWDYGNSSGLFSWTKPPSTACRDGASVTAAAGLPRAAALPQHQGQAALDSANRPPATGFTFSGTAYVGIGARF